MSKKMIVLTSSDGESFEVDEAVALQSQTIARIVEDGYADNVILLANVTGKVLGKVIDYCKKHEHVHVSDSSSSYFVDLDPSSMLGDLILAADHLGIKSLRDVTCQAVADMISSCTSSEEIRTKLGIENDFPPEEKEEVLTGNL